MDLLIQKKPNITKDKIKDMLLLSLLDNYCENSFSTVLQELKKIISIDDTDYNSLLGYDMLKVLNMMCNKNSNVVTLNSNYRNLVKIGSGSIGDVYGGVNVLDNCKYAIKRTQIDRLDKKLLKECRVLSTLNHQNIVKYNSVWIEKLNKQFYLNIQMELCQYDLKTFLRERDVTSRIEQFYFMDVMKGIKYLHSKQIIHRDIKPSNVLINNGIAKITDFNLCKDVNDRLESNELIVKDNEHTGEIGTELYSSPEQLEGSVYDEKTDIFSLGIIYYEVLTLFDDDIKRIQSITNLRNGTLKIDTLKKIERTLILKMINTNYRLRPDINDLCVYFSKRYKSFTLK